MKKATLIFCTVFCFVFLLKAQLVEVTADQNKMIKMASSVARKIPYVGPFISPITSLIFGEPHMPEYKELKAEWEGYTNKRILDQRKKDLLALLDGKKNILIEINKLDSLIEYDSRMASEYQDRKVKKLESIIENMDQDIQVFKSQDDEPAAPILSIFGAVTNLYISAYDQLILFYKYTQPVKRDAYRKLRSIKCVELNAKIETEIQKAAEERGSQVVTKKSQSIRQFPAGKGIVKTVTHYHYAVYDQGKEVFTLYGTAPPPIDIERERIYNEVKNHFISNARKYYRIPESTVLKIQLLNSKVTSGVLLEMFSLLNPFAEGGINAGIDSGFVKNWGLVYSKDDKYVVVTRHPNTNEAPWDRWTSAQYGYVEMETAFALESKLFWTGTKAKKFINGESSFMLHSEDKIVLKDPAYNNLVIDIDHLFDPWNWKWRFE